RRRGRRRVRRRVRDHPPGRGGRPYPAVVSGEMETARQADLVRQRAFRDARGLFRTGVTLVTARGPDGEDQAITANSVTSVSLDPLLLLVCVAHASRLHHVGLSAGRFAVSVLGLDGEPLSRKLRRPGHHTPGAL